MDLRALGEPRIGEERLDPMTSRSRYLWLPAAILYCFLYAPIGIVVLYSFNQAPYGAGWTGFTTHWYGVLRNNRVAWDAARNSLTLAATSTLISTVLGAMLGLCVARFCFRGKQAISRSLLVPLVVPDIVMAVAFMLLFAYIHRWTGHLKLGMQTMILAHVTFQLPFVAMVVRARLAGMDPLLEQAARDLGAGAWRAFWHVTLPLAFPGIVAAALLAFTLSLDDFLISFFTTGPGSTTLPILIYSSVKRGITPDINALSTCFILASLAATLLVVILQKKPPIDAP